MRAILRFRNLIYLFEQDMIFDGDYYLNKKEGIDRERFDIGREGYKLIKTNDPSFATIDGLEGEAEELLNKYPQGVTTFEK